MFIVKPSAVKRCVKEGWLIKSDKKSGIQDKKCLWTDRLSTIKIKGARKNTEAEYVPKG